MANQSFQRSIRFTKREWDAVIEAAEKARVTPGTFVRKASARAAAGEIDRDEGRQSKGKQIITQECWTRNEQ